ncbi:thioredoxin-disulfide reductase, partial [Candidatus Woesebacteria bacterium GWB1_37_5]
PAALTAAIYTTRGAASTLILGGEIWGGQLMLTTTVDNYPGFPEGVQGPDLMQLMRAQTERFGAEFVQKNVEAVDFNPPSGGPKELIVDGKKYLAKSVIIATGADTKWLGVPGEEKFRGRGVSSCAPCDAPFFKDKDVAVVGGGDAAMEEALVLTKYAKNVTVIHRRDQFKASQAMQQRVLDKEKEGKVKILWNTETVEFLGEQKLEKIKIKNNETGELSEMPIDGVFVAIGHIPATEMFKKTLELDERGYIVRMPTDYQGEVEEKKHFHTKTSISGVFVAGDVHDHVYRQAITAAGFGCMAGMDALRYLDKQAPSW